MEVATAKTITVVVVKILVKHALKAKGLLEGSASMSQKLPIGDIDPVIGRDEEIIRVIEILNRQTKNNPVLIGNLGSERLPLWKAWLKNRRWRRST